MRHKDRLSLRNVMTIRVVEIHNCTYLAITILYLGTHLSLTDRIIICHMSVWTNTRCCLCMPCQLCLCV